VFAAYGAGGRADQAIFHAELRPFFQRKDLQLSRVQPVSPLVMGDPEPPTRSEALASAESEREQGPDLDLLHAFGEVER
jgi:hypothetical protein